MLPPLSSEAVYQISFVFVQSQEQLDVEDKFCRESFVPLDYYS